MTVNNKTCFSRSILKGRKEMIHSNERLDIRRLNQSALTDIKNMPTGIEDDYVLKILDDVIQREPFFGVFINQTLVAYGAYTIYENKFAVLGRLRTHMKFRGQGIASKLLHTIKDVITENEVAEWVGLTTLEDNVPVHHIAGILGLPIIERYVCCRIEPDSVLDQRQQPIDTTFLTGYDSANFIQNNFPPIEHRALNVFPYACYYPLPVDPCFFKDDLLARHTVITSQGGWLSALPDQKGKSYLHLKYYGDDLDAQQDLLAGAADLAKRQGRTLWVDVPHEVFHRLKTLYPEMEASPWRLYGTYIHQNHLVND